jgi:hypothetical protein
MKAALVALGGGILLAAILILMSPNASADVHVLLQRNSTAQNQNELGNCTDGDSVWLEEGTYTLTAKWTVGVQDLLINGTGNSTIILGGTYAVFEANNTINLSVSSVNITGTGYGISGGWPGSITVNNCVLNTGNGYPVYSYLGTGPVTVSNSWITSTSLNGIVQGGTGNLTVSNCIIDGSAGVKRRSEGNISITNTNITSNNKDAVIQESNGNITITNSNISSTSNGVTHEGTGDVNIVTSDILGGTFAVVHAGNVILTGCYNLTTQHIGQLPSVPTPIHTLLLTNTTAQNQAEINNCDAGDYLWLEEGMYANNDEWTVSRDIIINGTGADTTTVSTVASKAVWRTNGPTHIVISGMTLDASSGSYGVYQYPSREIGDVNITSCNISGQYGIYGAGNVTLINCNISASRGVFIYSTGVGNVTLNSTNITSALGVDHRGTGELNISQCNITGGVRANGDINIDHSDITDQYFAAITAYGFHIFLTDCYNITAAHIGQLALSDIHILMLANTTTQNQNELGNCTSGDFVWFETGEYTLTAPLSVGVSDLIINGTGTSTTILVRGMMEIDGVFIINNTNNVTFIGINFFSMAENTQLISHAGDGNITVINCKIESMGGNAIYHAGNGNITSITSFINASNNAIYHAGNGNISIDESSLFGGNGVIISLGNSSSVVVNNTMMYSALGGAISMTDTNGEFGNITVMTSTISTSGNAISLGVDGTIRVEDSSISSSSGYGVTRTTNGDIYINSSDISAPYGEGVGVLGTDNIFITNSTVFGGSASAQTGEIVYLSGCYNYSVHEIKLGAGNISIIYQHGLGLFSLPNNNTQYTTAFDVATLEGVLYIAFYDPSEGAWTKYTHMGTGTDYPLVFGVGYLVYFTSEVNITFNNTIANTSVNYSLTSPGVQMISNPSAEVVQASVMISSSNVLYVAVWDANFTAFEKYVPAHSSQYPSFEVPAYGVVWIYTSQDNETIVYVGV